MIILLKDNDIIFVKLNNDWREETKQIKVKDYNESLMRKLNISDEDLEKINKEFRSNHLFLTATFKDESTGVKHSVKREEFDPVKMELVYSTEESEKERKFNIKDIIESQSAPGIVSSVHEERASCYHNGKLDDGAVSNLLDQGLGKAKKRAVTRNKKIGHSFHKNNINRFYRRKKHGRR